MKITKVGIRNFLAIGEANMSLDDRGLVLVQGENLDDDSANSNGAGKCLANWTQLTDAESGLTMSVEEWKREFDNGRSLTVMGLDDDLKLRETKVSDVFKTGKKRIVRVRLKNGHHEDVSETHPVITSRGEVMAKDLIDGDVIQTPRRLAVSGVGMSPFTNSDVIVLAGLMAEGSLTKSGYGFTNEDSEIVSIVDSALRCKNLKLVPCSGNRERDLEWRLSSTIGRVSGDRKRVINDVVRLCDEYGVQMVSSASNSIGIRAGERGPSFDALMRWSDELGCDRFLKYANILYPHESIRREFKSLGIHNTLSKDKVLPGQCHLMSDDQIGSFVRIFWACDGYVSDATRRRGKGGHEISLTLASESLILGISRLLLRLGVKTSVKKRVTRRGFSAWRMTPVGRESILAMCDILKTMPCKMKRDRVLNITNVVTKSCRNNNLDLIPADVFFKAVESAKRKNPDKNWHSRKDGVSYSKAQLRENARGRDKAAKYAKYYNSDENLLNIANSDISWVGFDCIEDLGVSDTYDITVGNKTHLYALAGFITHNSSLVDAISWCLFGTTARGVTGDEVVNNVAKKNCSVHVTIDDDGTEYDVSRYRKHGKCKNGLFVTNATGGHKDVTRGTTKLTQEMIEKIIGCSADVFNAAVYAGQEQMPDLPGMTDKQLKLLVEEASGIEKLQAAHVVVQQKLRVAESARDGVENKIATLKSNMATESVKLKGSVVDRDGWLGKNDFEIKGRVDLVKSLSDDFAYLKTKAARECRQKAKIQEDIENLSKKLDEKTAGEEKLEEFRDSVYKKKRRVTEIGYDISTIKVNARTCRKRVDEANDIVGTPCGECGKEYHEEDVAAAVVLANKGLRNCLISLKSSKAELKDAEEQLSQANSELKKFSDSMIDLSEFSTLSDDCSAELRRVVEYESKLEKTNVDIEKASNAAVFLRAKENPYSKMVESQSAAIELMTKDVIALEKANLPIAQANVDLLKDAVDVFGRSGVRAHILDTVTPFLNERTGDYLSALTDGAITANWSTISKTSKGDLREKFVIDIEKKNGARKFRGLSGGEKRKVRIATSMALQDLVASRATKPISLFMGDELDDALDEAGLERLMGILVDKAKRIGTILLISHNSIADWCPNVITVVNDGGLATLKE